MSLADELARKHVVNEYKDATPLAEQYKLEKEKATADGKPWVKVIDVKVNPDNVKHGFFEIDWNDQFIDMLFDHGFTGESQEAVVDKWFNAVIMEIMDNSEHDGSVMGGNVVDFLQQP